MNARTQLAILHTFVLGPFLLYVGLAREQVPDALFTSLLGLGVVIFGYHAFKAYGKIMQGQSAWVNYIHIFLLAPLLIIIGYYGKNASRRFFEMLLLLGFSAVGYHGLNLVRDFIQ